MMRLIDDWMAWLIGKRCLWRLSVIAFSLALWGAGIAIWGDGGRHLLRGVFAGYVWWSLFWGAVLVWPKVVEDPGILAHPEFCSAGGLLVWAVCPWLLLAAIVGPLGGGIYAFLAYFFGTFLGKGESAHRPSGN